MHWPLAVILLKWIGIVPDRMIANDRTLSILGFPTTDMTEKEIIHTVRQWLSQRDQSRHLMALNPIKVCRARKEPALAQHIFEADLVYPDAFGIAWAMRRYGRKKHQPIPGCDLMMAFIRIAAENHYSVYLIGSQQDVIEKAKNLLLSDFPSLKISGIRNGYFQKEEDYQKLLEQLAQSKPDMVFVGMGALIQENLVKRIRDFCTTSGLVIPLLMGVGGSFDAITNTVRRPPRWMLALHLEWLFRLLQQPFRAPRMLALPHFALLVLAKKWLKMRVDYTLPKS